MKFSDHFHADGDPTPKNAEHAAGFVSIEMTIRIRIHGALYGVGSLSRL